jgi:hypothetical protein
VEARHVPALPAEGRPLMKITIENTSKIVELEGAVGRMPARVWEGHTESGIPVHCYVTRIAVARELDTEQFERELIECRQPSAKIEQAIPLRLVL